jgi:hypothetical protein
MTKNTWALVPDGVPGQGSADPRPYGDVVVRAAAQPPFAVRLGTGLPVAARLRKHSGVVVSGTPATGTPCTPRGEFIAQHDGTTLGFHTSSRPLS